MKNKLSHKLVGQIVMIGFLIMIAIILFTTNIIQDYERTRMIEVTEVMASAVQSNTSEAFNDLIDQANYLKKDISLMVEKDTVDGYSLNKTLVDFLKYNRDINGAYIILETAEYVYHPYWYIKDDKNYRSYLEDYEETLYKQIIAEGNVALQDPKPYMQGENTAILSTVIVPFEAANGVSGVVGVNFSIDLFESFIQEVKLSDMTEGYLVSSNGLIIGGSGDSRTGLSFEEAGIQPDWLTDKFVSNGLVRSGDFYVMNIPIEMMNIEQNWNFVVTVPYSVLHSENRVIQLLVAIPLLIGISLLAIFVRFTVKKNLNPIENILHVMESAENGVFDKRTHVSSSDEIQVIADGLNDLLDSLEDHHEKLLKEIDDNELLNADLEELMQENDRIYFETIKSLNMAIEAKDRYTAGHCDRVTEYSLAIADEIGMRDKEKVRLIYGATVHDIGKIGIPGTIINKPGRLNDAEFERIKSHPEKGYHILKEIHFLEDSIPIVYQHHERYDGKGYPQGLSGDEIDISARIVAIADTYDAMTSDRAYRQALTSDIALDEIKRNSGLQFDPILVDAFVRAFDRCVIVEESIDSITKETV